MNLTRAEFDAMVKGNPRLAEAMAKQGGARPKKRSKYGAVATYVDGIRFDSRKEAARFMALKVLKDAGEVLWFARQPRFALPGGVEYVADFVVVWNDGGVTVEDVKGVKTKEYRLKKRQVEALYRVTITEV